MQPASPLRVHEDGGSSVARRAREWASILVRATRRALEDDVPMLASAVAYSAFFAIPSTLLLSLGVFSLVADPGLIGDVMDRLGAVVPADAVTLVQGSLLQLQASPSAGIAMTAVGFALALWSATGAAGTVMTAVNRAHERVDSRGFARRRLAALALVVCLGLALVLLTVLLILGPHVERWIGTALHSERVVAVVWWTGEWPVLVAALFGAFAAVLALACDGAERRWRIATPGAGFAVVTWLATSAAFALYASRFGAYNKTWGTLSAAIVTLTWLWLSALALLLGAEVDAEAERSRDRERQR